MLIMPYKICYSATLNFKSVLDFFKCYLNTNKISNVLCNIVGSVAFTSVIILFRFAMFKWSPGSSILHAKFVVLMCGIRIHFSPTRSFCRRSRAAMLKNVDFVTTAAACTIF